MEQSGPLPRLVDDVTVHDHLAEVELAALLGMPRPAPAAWVASAQELPAARGELEHHVALAELDAQVAQALREDLDATLAEDNVVLPAALRRELSERLREA
jgi:hypothetical protein